MADPARARRLAKRISTIVASAIEFEIKDPRLTGVTITDTKVTADLHDATLYYTVIGKSLRRSPTTRAWPLHWQAPQVCCARGWGRALVFASPRRWPSCATPCPTAAHGWRSCWPALAPQMRIWREFDGVPSTQVTKTRIVRTGGGGTARWLG